MRSKLLKVANDVRWVLAWAIAIAGIGCGGPAFTDASQFDALPGKMVDASTCFPSYPGVNVILTQTAAEAATTSGVAYGPSSTVCSACEFATFAYRTYDGLPPEGLCAHASGSSDYCCNVAVCVPAAQSSACSSTVGAPYLWTCPVGTAPPADGCQPEVGYPAGAFCCRN